MVPLTRGSTTTLWPDSVAKVLATASISALLKFRVTGSCAGLAGALAFAFLLTLGACALTLLPRKAKGKQTHILISSCVSRLLWGVDLEVCVQKTMMFNPMKASCARLGAAQ